MFHHVKPFELPCCLKYLVQINFMKFDDDNENLVDDDDDDDDDVSRNVLS